MKDETRIKALEDEVKILKNEVKSVLLDVREQYLNIQNPFNMNTVPSAGGMAMGNMDSPAVAMQPSTTEEVGNTEEETAETDTRAAEPSAAKEEKPLNKDERAELYKTTDGDMPVSMPAGGERTAGSSQETFSSFWPKRDGDHDDDDRAPSGFGAYRAEKKKKGNGSVAVKSEVDLVVIAGLTQWIDQATAKLGRERTEILIEMSFTMGHLPENLKDALVKMTRISRNDSTDKTATASDYLAILAQLENLLAGSQLKENALLSILSMIKDTKNG